MGLNQPLTQREARPVPPARAQVSVAIAVLVSVLLYVVACVAGGSYGSAFFAIPYFVGFTAGALYPRRPYAASFVGYGIALVLSVITLREGVICLLFALPVFTPLLVLGAFSGSRVVGHLRHRKQRDGMIGLVVLVGAGWQAHAGLSDEPLRHPRHVASDARLIDAPPSAVFAALTSSELKLAPRWPWFLRVGLPMPERLTVDRAGPNGRLHFDFSQGTAFAQVTTWDEPRELAYAVTGYEIHDLPFHITRLGRSPDYGFRRERVQDWLTVENTRYELTPAGEGRTLLRRTIRWRRHLAPDVYFGWLQQTVIERSQRRLLELIAEQVEQRERLRREETRQTAALW